jgi:hypothetical protein
MITSVSDGILAAAMGFEGSRPEEAVDWGAVAKHIFCTFKLYLELYLALYLNLFKKLPFLRRFRCNLRYDLRYNAATMFLVKVYLQITPKRLVTKWAYPKTAEKSSSSPCAAWPLGLSFASCLS